MVFLHFSKRMLYFLIISLIVDRKKNGDALRLILDNAPILADQVTKVGRHKLLTIHTIIHNVLFWEIPIHDTMQPLFNFILKYQSNLLQNVNQ